MKKFVKGVITIAVIICAVMALLSGYSSFLTGRIERLYQEKEDALSLVNGSPVKDKGNIWIRQSAAADDIMIMGSSELSAPVDQNIKYEFPNTLYEHNLSCVGHATVQNMLHAMDLGANEDSFKGSDVVVIESIQWFFGQDSDPDGFMSNFSELQFYEFLHNPDVSVDNKRYLARRFLEMESRRTAYMTSDQIAALADGNKVFNDFGITKVVSDHGGIKEPTQDYDFPQTHLLAKLYVSDNFFDKCLYTLLRPYYFIRSRILQLRDRYDTYQAFKDADGSYKKDEFAADWDAQLSRAESDGKEACTNNDFYVYDDYYTTYLKDNLESSKDANVGVTALESKEWDDFRFFLSVCNELGIKPYIINVSCNAHWYDYTGLDPEMRQKYYTELENVADEYGIPMYSDLKTKEYEPYVFADIMHLGWKGWIYVSKAVTEHFTK